MISLEQVLLLETKIAKAIDYIKKVSEDKEALLQEKELLQSKLDTYQKRIDELEVHVIRFKEDQGRIEDGIISALDRLSQFEEAFENSLKDKPPAKKPSKPREKTIEKNEKTEDDSQEEFFEIPEEKNDDVSSEKELDIF